MATEKNLLGRIIHKHDIESNWNRAVNFVPKQGEIIVYDIDEVYSYERFKIGDGQTLAMDLPFYLESEMESVLEKIDFLAKNTLDAEWQNGVLIMKKGITIS